MTNLLVGDFIDFIFLKSFVVGIGFCFLPATFADKASRHYHSTTILYNLSFPFSLFCRCFVANFIVAKSFLAYFIVANFIVGCSLAVKSVAVSPSSPCVLVPAKSFNNVRYFYLTAISFFTSFWAVSAICLSWIDEYYLLLVTYTLDGSVPFSRLLFRILTRITSVFASFHIFLSVRGFLCVI